jgi:hypothetical protein
VSYASWIGAASRAFPRRWRAERGHELIETVIDLAPPDRHRPSLAVVADIVTAGLRERWRTHPPLWHWLGYAMTRRLPRQWHPWLRDDLTGRWFWARNAVRSNGALILLFSVAHAAARGNSPFTFWYFAFLLSLGAVSSRWMRPRTWRLNGYNSDGTSWQAPKAHSVGHLVGHSVEYLPPPPTPSHPMAPSLCAMGVALMVTSLGWLYGAAFPHQSFTVAGLTFRHDPNSPTTRGVVGMLAAGGLGLGLIVGLAAAAAFARQAVGVRPALGPSAPRRKTMAHLLIFFTLTFAAFVAATGVYPALATAVIGSATLFVGSGATLVGLQHRSSSVTWADVLNRSHLRSTTGEAK